MSEPWQYGCATSLLVFVGAFFALTYLSNSDSNLVGERWVVQKQYEREFNLGKSFGGHFEIESLKAIFQPKNGTPIELFSASLNSNSWTDSELTSKEINVVKVKGVPVVTGRGKMKAKIILRADNRNILASGRGEIQVSGKVKFPFYSYADVAADIGQGVKYTIESKEFEETIPDVKFVSDASKEKDGVGLFDGILYLLLLGSVVGALISLGNKT